MRASRVLPLVLLAGCYTYQPAPGRVAAAGNSIDVELNDFGVRELAGKVGPGIERVQGRVVAADSSLIDLSVIQVENTRGEPTEWNGERLRLPTRYVRGIQERRLSAGGTGLLGGVVAATLIAGYRLLDRPSSAAGPPGETGGSSGH
jgi:hypothetical protein